MRSKTQVVAQADIMLAVTCGSFVVSTRAFPMHDLPPECFGSIHYRWVDESREEVALLATVESLYELQQTQIRLNSD